jgi:hypothetical protein
LNGILGDHRLAIENLGEEIKERMEEDGSKVFNEEHSLVANLGTWILTKLTKIQNFPKATKQKKCHEPKSLNWSSASSRRRQGKGKGKERKGKSFHKVKRNHRKKERKV